MTGKAAFSYKNFKSPNIGVTLGTEFKWRVLLFFLVAALYVFHTWVLSSIRLPTGDEYRVAHLYLPGLNLPANFFDYVLQHTFTKYAAIGYYFIQSTFGFDTVYGYRMVAGIVTALYFLSFYIVSRRFGIFSGAVLLLIVLKMGTVFFSWANGIAIFQYAFITFLGPITLIPFLKDRWQYTSSTVTFLVISSLSVFYLIVGWVHPAITLLVFAGCVALSFPTLMNLERLRDKKQLKTALKPTEPVGRAFVFGMSALAGSVTYLTLTPHSQIFNIKESLNPYYFTTSGYGGDVVGMIKFSATRFWDSLVSIFEFSPLTFGLSMPEEAVPETVTTLLLVVFFIGQICCLFGGRKGRFLLVLFWSFVGVHLVLAILGYYPFAGARYMKHGIFLYYLVIGYGLTYIGGQIRRKTASRLPGQLYDGVGLLCMIMIGVFIAARGVDNLAKGEGAYQRMEKAISSDDTVCYSLAGYRAAAGLGLTDQLPDDCIIGFGSGDSVVLPSQEVTSPDALVSSDAKPEIIVTIAGRRNRRNRAFFDTAKKAGMKFETVTRYSYLIAHRRITR